MSCEMRKTKVLISGASIAGPAVAYWLARYGSKVTVVERAGAVRGGGYPIDIRGSAIEVVERMGLIAKLRAAHIDTRKLTFVDAQGKTIAEIRPEGLTGGESGRDIELPRGALTSLLYELTQHEAIRYLFNDSIDQMEDNGAEVRVRFTSGQHDRFDIVIGADGLHSNTRLLTFGPEKPFNRYLGRCFNLFSLPNFGNFSHEGVTYADPGHMAGVYAVGEADRLHAFLIYASDEPPFQSHLDVEQQRRRTAKEFAEGGWEVERLVRAMQQDEDLYFDTVSQILMPAWSRGRVVLVGDAAYAPSFLSGQGSSLALVGAYVLAGELASQATHEEAFASYERIVRPFVELNQALAQPGGSMLLPRTKEELERRNQGLSAGEFSAESGEHAAKRRQVHNAITLPAYDHLLR